MKSEGIKSTLKSVADAVAANAGDGYAAEDPRTINWIGIVNVYPETKEAGRDNYANNTLLKAVGAVGLPLTKGGK